MDAKVRVTGQFEVTLPVPIAVTPDFRQGDVQPRVLQIEGSTITMQPLRIERVDYEGDYPDTTLRELRVWIMQEVRLEPSNGGNLTLPREEQRSFEPILLEAIRRFVAAVKNGTRQWNLDTRHPVHSYDYVYTYQDSTVETPFPLDQGSRLLPQYALDAISIGGGDLHGELGIDQWEQTVGAVERPIDGPIYEELLFDARTFRSNMRYDAAVLYAAFAVEQMVEELARRLLKTRGNLTDKQCNTLLNGRGFPSRLRLVNELNHALNIDARGLTATYDLRSRIAHQGRRITPVNEANDAIRRAERLRQMLVTKV